MSSLSDFIHRDFYPALFERIDLVFPNMHFERWRGGWRSPLCMDETKPSKPRPQHDKCVITNKVPTRVLEQGGGSMDLIEYYASRNGMSTDSKEAHIPVRAMCDKMGMQFPELQDSGEYAAYREKQEKLLKSIKEMQSALYSDEGKEVLSYLKGRGYDDEFIKYAEFGYVSPATASTLRGLFTYDKNGVEVCMLPYDTGTTYTLAIPYRTGGRIAGFVFRRLDGQFPKYKQACISASANRSLHLFGLTGLNLNAREEYRKDLTIVEGEIDALRAQYAGLQNVVGIGGKELKVEALLEAKSRGVTRVTLLLDTEDEGNEASVKKNLESRERDIWNIYRAGLKPFVADIPSENGEKMDVDEYLKNHTGEELQEVVNDVISGGFYLFLLLKRKLFGERRAGDYTLKEIDELKSQTIELANSPYLSQMERAQIFNSFAASTNQRITEEDIADEANKIKAIEDRNRQKKETLSALADAYNIAKDGGVDKALEMIGSKIRDLKDISLEEEFSKYLIPPTRAEILSRWKEKPTGLSTQYAFGYGDRREEFMLQSAALTYICAPTSHGKSRMLQNLALYQARKGGEGDILYISLEEDSTAVEQEFLNIFIGQRLSRNNLRTLNSYYSSGDTRWFEGAGTNHQTGLQILKDNEGKFFRLTDSGKLRIMAEPMDSKRLIGYIRYMCKNLKIRAVFVDYIQLLHTRGFNGGRKEELADMSRDLMILSKEVSLPVVLAAQLNREAYSPIEMNAQNIAEASEIEHSANTIMVLWNSSEKPSPKSNYFISKDSRKPSSDAAEIEGKNDFQIGTEGKMYAKLVKNRGGIRNISAILDFSGNTGVISQNDYTPKASAEEQPLPLEPQQNSGDSTGDDYFLN